MGCSPGWAERHPGASRISLWPEDCLDNAMGKDFTIGLVVPFATDTVPDEGLAMYPHVRFLPRGVGVRSLTSKGYDSAWERIVPAAEQVAALGVDAIMVIGISLTFYRGADAHAWRSCAGRRACRRAA